jgi:hypothetical protein
MAWACRHDGAAGIETPEDYRRIVPAPATISDLRGYAMVQGWLNDAGPEELRQRIAGLIKQEWKLFDYPSQKAREQGGEFEDRRSEAYYVKDEARLLSYRDAGINQRWKFFEEGFGLKGSAQQAAEFERLLCVALGMPALRAFHHNADNTATYSLSYEDKKRKWLAVSPPPLTVAPKTRIALLWRKPWTRPERFAFSRAHLGRLPKGHACLLFDQGFDELPTRRLEGLLNKGISSDVIARSYLVPLQVRGF